MKEEGGGKDDCGVALTVSSGSIITSRNRRNARQSPVQVQDAFAWKRARTLGGIDDRQFVLHRFHVHIGANTDGYTVVLVVFAVPSVLAARLTVAREKPTV